MENKYKAGMVAIEFLIKEYEQAIESAKADVNRRTAALEGLLEAREYLWRRDMQSNPKEKE